MRLFKYHHRVIFDIQKIEIPEVHSENTGNLYLEYIYAAVSNLS